jgi:hypothetical protein
MGSALYIVLERDIPGVDALAVDGRALSCAADELDLLANRLGLKPLMEFFSMDPAEAGAWLEDVGGLDGLDVPDETWFEAAEGLQTVDPLLAHLANNPKDISESDRVLVDLRAFQSVLQRASAERVRWHLVVDC